MNRAVSMVWITSLLAGCASTIEGTTQTIAINTEPPGAACSLYRQGNRIGQVESTPGSVLIEKTKQDITVICRKTGRQQASSLNRSGTAAATFGNILMSGVIGWAVDSARGADNKYDGVVTITLPPDPAASPSTRALPLPALQPSL